MEAGEPQDCTSWLPDELALRILSYLDAKDILQVAQTCQRWRELAEDEGLWEGKCKADGIEEPPQVTRSRAKGSGSGPWRRAYTNQLRVDTNWHRGRCKTIKLDMHYDDLIFSHWTFDGKEMVCIGIRDKIKIFSAVTGKWLRSLVGHTKSICAIRMRDHMIVSGSEDQTVKVWNAESGECIHTLGGHTGAVCCVNLHEERIVSGSRDGTIRIWDTETGRCLHDLTLHHQNIVYVQYDGQRVLSVDDYSMVKIWEQKTQSCLLTFPSPIYNIRHLELSGRRLLVVTRNGAITVWDTDTGECIQTVTDLQNYIAAVSVKANMLVSNLKGLRFAFKDIKNKDNLEILKDSKRFQRYMENLRLRRKFETNISGFGPVPLWDMKSNIGIDEVTINDNLVFEFLVSPTKLVCLIVGRFQAVKVLVLDFGNQERR
uniref:F-box domain-containing protein n=1 Tax=Xenopus tropicalis TaxID=8364 RepID=A0A1B8Y7Q2_XENTR|eukprot:XP_017945066.1 PREDICTED: F-box/WD repeat-containing protein 7-like [Xenopus tropicalis]